MKLEQENSPQVQKLLEYVKLGYVFHGSDSNEISKLEPRPATDEDEFNTFTNDTAVFAATYPTASVIFACMSQLEVPEELQDETWSVEIDEDKIIVKISKKCEQYVRASKGFVYVLDSATFFGPGKDQGGWQVKSKETVEPVDIVEVTFADFEQLGGIVIWED